MEKRYSKDMRTRTADISTRIQGPRMFVHVASRRRGDRPGAARLLPVAAATLLALFAAVPSLFGQSVPAGSATTTVAATTIADTTPRQILTDGLTAFSKADYTTALLRFRELTIHPGDPMFQPYAADGYFWVAKSAMALNRLDEAQRNLEYFLMNYPKLPAFVEASYLKGRLLFMQQDYQSAIQVFQKFISQFSTSPFIANAYYWSGESLYILGQFDSAKKLFLAVVDNFPTSYRVDAARYHLSLIDQKKREEELLKLLQWSHEEALRSLDDYQNQIRTYKEAIAAYQKRLAGQPNDGLSQEITRLSGQIHDLQGTLSQRDQTIQELQKQLADLQGQPQKPAPGAQSQAQSGAAPDSSGSYRQELLDMQQQTQQLKQYLQQEMQKQQGGAQ